MRFEVWRVRSITSSKFQDRGVNLNARPARGEVTPSSIEMRQRGPLAKVKCDRTGCRNVAEVVSLRTYDETGRR